MFSSYKINVLICSISLCGSALGHAAPCDRLSTEQKKISQKLLRETYPYDCCDAWRQRPPYSLMDENISVTWIPRR
jgi:hypothetical protein